MMKRIKITNPVDGETVCTAAKYDKAFSECRHLHSEKKLIKKIMKREGDVPQTRPAPVPVEWDGGNAPFILEISENSDFENSTVISVNERRYNLYNLKKCNRYFIRINGSDAVSFMTDDIFPRWIFADGCYNIRDIGFETNSDGIKIRQGLAYRGVKLEESITENGISALRSLSIKTQIDLRKEAEGLYHSSALGEDVNYFNFPCDGYENFVCGRTAELISYFADENNYPVYFNCFGGQDRTGTLALMLGAILKVDDTTLIRDYEMTMLSNPGQKADRSRKHKAKGLIRQLKKESGKGRPLYEGAISLLLKNGVTQDTIEKIREIFYL